MESTRITWTAFEPEWDSKRNHFLKRLTKFLTYLKADYNRDDIEDMIQKGSIRIHERNAKDVLTFDSEEHLERYIFRVFKHIAIDFLRAQKSRQKYECGSINDPLPGSSEKVTVTTREEVTPDTRPEITLLSAEDKICLRELLERLGGPDKKPKKVDERLYRAIVFVHIDRVGTIREFADLEFSGSKNLDGDYDNLRQQMYRAIGSMKRNPDLRDTFGNLHLV